MYVKQYWPEEGDTITAGKFTVTNVGPQLVSDYIIVTNLTVSYQGRLKVVTVTVI